MKTINYKKGDVVLLIDGGRYKRFEYLGRVVINGRMRHAYRPLDGETEYATIKDAAGEFAMFSSKLAVKAVKMKWYDISLWCV